MDVEEAEVALGQAMDSERMPSLWLNTMPGSCAAAGAVEVEELCKTTPQT